MTFCTFCPLYAILGRFGGENFKQTAVKMRKMAEKFTEESSGRSLRNVSPRHQGCSIFFFQDGDRCWVTEASNPDHIFLRCFLCV